MTRIELADKLFDSGMFENKGFADAWVHDFLLGNVNEIKEEDIKTVEVEKTDGWVDVYINDYHIYSGTYQTQKG